MKVKPLWKAYRDMLESAGVRHDLCPDEPTGWAARNALYRREGRIVPKPVVAVRVGSGWRTS